MASDTSCDLADFQIELLRRATVAERLALVVSLTRTTIGLSRRAIARANPRATQRELDLIFVDLHYGSDLADRVRAHREARAP
jgi:hypothetical protein